MMRRRPGLAFVSAWAPLLLLLPPLIAGLKTLPPDEREGISQEMMDLEESNRKQGFATGVTGEFFRYKHLFYKQPSEKDRDEAIGVATKIRCDVCTEILSSLVKKAADLSGDELADKLEGNTDYEKTGDPVEDRMLAHKKGCNKHFKDELIAEGFTLKPCKEVFPEGSETEPCLARDGSKPNDMAINSYEVWKESLFYACEQTVSRYSDDLAEFLASELPGSGNRTATIRNACESLAKCSSDPKRSASKRETRSKSGTKSRRKRKKKQRDSEL